MLNEFRTLMMNLSYAGDATEHIPSTYQALSLPDSLLGFYNVLYPVGCSRFYTLFATHQYLQMISSTLYRDVVWSHDTRISYDLNDSRYFKFRRNSVPNAFNTAFPIFIYGNFVSNVKTDSLNDVILIRQIASTSHVTVGSVTNPGKVYIADQELIFTNDVSQIIEIPGTNLKFQISGASFTGSANKTWSFYTEDVLPFDFPSFYLKLDSNPDPVERMLGYNRNLVDVKYENLWRHHSNQVYRVTGLLVGYVERMRTLWAR